MKFGSPLLLAVLCISCGGGGGSNPASQEAVARTEPFWVQRNADIVAEAKARNHEIVVLGDSTASMLGGGPAPDYPMSGEAAFRSVVGDRPILNAGITGDHVSNVRWRVRNGCLQGQNPKLIALMVGANDLMAENTEVLANAITTLESEVRARCPGAVVMVFGSIPYTAVGSTIRGRQNLLNRRLRERRFRSFADISDLVLLPNGEVDSTLMDNGPHPTRTGYEKIVGSLRTAIEAALQPQ